MAPKYFSAGEKQFKSLASPEYIATPGTHDSILIKHATGNYLRNSELDGGLSYADEYFERRLTNASSESFNAKIKVFRTQFRGVGDIKFFMFRPATLYS